MIRKLLLFSALVYTIIKEVTTFISKNPHKNNIWWDAVLGGKGNFMSIINFGSLNYDYIYQVPHYSVGNETLRSRNMRRCIGGRGLKQSIALSRAGISVCHAGLIGRNGEELKQVLADNFVDTSLLGFCDTIQGHSFIQQLSPTGKYASVIYGGSNSQLTPEIIDRCLENYGKGDFLLVQNEITSIPYLIDAAYDKGMRILFNTSPVDEDIFRTACNKVEWLVMNELECMEIADCDEITAAFSKLQTMYPKAGILLCLADEEGYIAYQNGEVLVQKSYNDKIANLLDVDHVSIGYFTAGLTLGYSLAECLELAAKAAAISVSREGGILESCPTMAEVEAFQV
jgi:ribokinase